MLHCETPLAGIVAAAFQPILELLIGGRGTPRGEHGIQGDVYQPEGGSTHPCRPQVGLSRPGFRPLHRFDRLVQGGFSFGGFHLGFFRFLALYCLYRLVQGGLGSGGFGFGGCGLHRLFSRGGINGFLHGVQALLQFLNFLIFGGNLLAQFPHLFFQLFYGRGLILGQSATHPA